MTEARQQIRHAPPNPKRCPTCANTTCPKYSQRMRVGKMLSTVEDRFALFQTAASLTAEIGCDSHIEVTE